MSQFDIMYFDGPGNTIGAFNAWRNNENIESVTAKTYSSHIFDYCKDNNLKCFMISSKGIADTVETEQFRVSCIPKKVFGDGMLYHLTQIFSGVNIIFLALKYRPKYLGITTGETYFFLLAPLKLFGIKIVAHMHNCLWPHGYRPTSFVKTLLLNLDAWFFKNIASAIYCMSPLIVQQIEELTENKHSPIYHFRAQFIRANFHPPAPLVPFDQKPFVILFAGRIYRNKGVFDLLDIVEGLQNDNVSLVVCGDGGDLDELKKECSERGLDKFFTFHGQLKRPELLDAYHHAHVVIVPTRNDFTEGLAKVAVEAILLNRPAICSSAFNPELALPGATVTVTANDIDGYVEAIRKVKNDPEYYASLSKNCLPLREQFLDGTQSLYNALKLFYLS